MMYDNVLNGVIRSDIACFKHLLKFADENPRIFKRERHGIIKKCYEYQCALEKCFVEKSIIQMIYIGFKYNRYFYSIRTYIKYLLLIVMVKIQK